MSKLLITIYPEWSNVLLDTLNDICIMELNQTTMFTMYHTLLSFSKHTHNFILDRDQLKYNSEIDNLIKALHTYNDVNLEVQTLQFYYTRFYDNHRYLFSLIRSPIKDIIPIMESNDLEIKSIVVQL